MEGKKVNTKYIRIAGNTEVPCYLTLLEKGYEVKIIECHLTNADGTDCCYEYEASKPGSEYTISATNIHQLLALVVMGETRGFSHHEWRANEDEIQNYFEIKDNVPIYDLQGNLVED